MNENETPVKPDNGPANKNEDAFFLAKYDTVLAFLSLEVLCLGSFALGGATGLTVFRILGFFLSVITIGYLFQNYRPEGKKRYWISLIPFVLLCLFLGFSRFFITGSSNVFGALANGAIVALGFLGFFLLGQGVKSISVLKKDIILLCIGGTLALASVIPGFYSLIRYGFFYAQKYAGMVYYYDGVVFTIANETKALDGFSFAEVSLSFGKTAAFLLSLSAVPCLFLSPKKETKRFLAFLAFGALGVLDLAIVPFWRALLIAAFVYVLAFVYRLVSCLVSKRNAQAKCDKTMRILFFVLIGLVAAALIVLFVDALTNSVFSKMPIASVKASRQSGVLSRLAKAIRSVFLEEGDDGKKLNLLGMLFGVSATYANDAFLTPFFEFSLLWQNGLLAFALFLFCLFFMIRESWRFLKNGEERTDYKVAIVFLLLGLLLYASLFNDELPYRHSTSFASWSRGSYPLLACFLSGLIYSHKEKGVSHE